MGLAGELLERAARASPAAVEDRSTGWWLRHTDNGAWWTGAVLAHGGSDDLAGRIDAAERFYARIGTPSRFQVCPDCPDGLDNALADRGYLWSAPISLLTASGPVNAGPGPTVRVDPTPGPGWLAVLEATSEPAADARHETRHLHRARLPQAFVTASVDGEPVGIGRAVADDGWTGVYSMATAPRARRSGVARAVLGAIAGWAQTQGAPRLYLQVEQSNDAARRLYASAGFTPLAAYHYRVQRSSAGRAA